MAQVIKADIDEMVFEDRERRYGAFFLRKRYPLRLTVSTLVVAFSIVAVSALAVRQGGARDKKKRLIANEITLENLPPPPQEDTPPPPPPPEVKIPPPQLKTVAFKIPEPTPKEELKEEEEIKTIDELKDQIISTKDQEGEENVPIPIVEEAPPPVIEKDEDPDINAFIFDAEEPKPVNMNDVRELIGYPDIAKEAQIEGTVLVRVLVDKQGNYKSHKIIRKAHPILSDAVEKQIARLRFTPAIQGGKPIPFWVNIPFNFKLIQ